MKISAWRITKRKHARTAFSGEGAILYGGRWNSPGVGVIYAAESQSLAVLKMLVHLDSAEILKHYVLFRIEKRLVAGLEKWKNAGLAKVGRN